MQQEPQDKKYFHLGKDIVFKHLFGTTKNIIFTKFLLSKILQKDISYFDGMEILNSVTLDRETIESRSFELDVVCRLKNGVLINLEMQNINSMASEIKNTFYAMDLFTNQAKKTEKYRYLNAKKIIGIVIINKDNIHHNEDLRNNYHISNDKYPSDKILPDLFHIMLVSLDEKTIYEYNYDKELIILLKLLKEEDIKIAKKLVKGVPILEKLLKEGIDFMYENYVQSYDWDEWIKLDDAESRGYAQGALENKKEIARKMLSSDMSIADISKFTGLTKKEIKNLKK